MRIQRLVTPCLLPRWCFTPKKHHTRKIKEEAAAAAAAKSHQSCQTLCDPIDGSPPGSPVPGILQARILEWVAMSFSEEAAEDAKLLAKRMKEVKGKHLEQVAKRRRLSSLRAPAAQSESSQKQDVLRATDKIRHQKRKRKRH